MKLADIKEEFAKYVILKDPWIIDVILGTVIGNRIIERDPIWTMVIGASSGGKTTLIAPLCGIDRVFFVDDLTEKTLLSGFKVKGKEMSLLRQIGSGMMAFSDFTSILAKNPTSRGEILTQLKLVYDGKITKYTGTGGIPWQGKIGFVGAATPDVYSHLENSRSMGERFLYYWLEQPTNEEVMAKQSELSVSSKEVTDTMAAMYGAYYEEIKAYAESNMPKLSITVEQHRRVEAAAIFCINGKATIRTDFKTGKPDAIPNISGVGRDIKIFDTLLHTLQLMNAYELGIVDAPVTDEMVAIVEKCAYSSINRERRKILEILVTEGKQLTATQIGAYAGLGLEKDSVQKYLAPLHAVGMIRKKASGNSHTWYVDDETVITFVKKAMRTVVDNTHVEALEVTGDEEDEIESQPLDPESQEIWDSIP